MPEVPSYRDFDHVIEVAFAIPILRELRSGFQHKNAVKTVVREFLERKTFALPPGLPLSFDSALAQGHGKIALGNLSRAEVINAVKKALLPELNKAINAERSTREAILSSRLTSESSGYQAIKKNVFDAPKRSNFDRAAFDSGDELRVAKLLDKCSDVQAWVFNHRSGIGCSIEYDWQGISSKYFPDFIVRAQVGAANVVHNFIIEVKGAFDERDRAKALRGQRYCELLTEHDKEPWHYIVLLENDSVHRNDIAWWESQSKVELGHLLRRQEGFPLLPEMGAKPTSKTPISVVTDVPIASQFRDALPVYDLAVSAGAFSETQVPTNRGWAFVKSARDLDKRMFLARIRGKSMEPGVPDGSWVVMRFFTHESPPAARALDGKRVLVELTSQEDPEAGGAYTLKRWRVGHTTTDGSIDELHLCPDNHDFNPVIVKNSLDGIRAVAEFIEVVR